MMTNDQTTPTPMTPARPKQRRGFAGMSLEKRRAIAAHGGRRAHVLGRAHEWTKAEARAAGQKGGSAPRAPRKKKQQQQSEVA